MSRDLRITLAIMIGALIVFAPVIFAAPGPAPTNYLALVMHIVAPTSPIPPTPTIRSTRTLVPTNTVPSASKVALGEPRARVMRPTLTRGPGSSQGSASK